MSSVFFSTYAYEVERSIRKNTQLVNLVENGSGYYSHFTCRIHSLSEYFAVLQEIDNTLRKCKNLAIGDSSIFRGMPDSRYDLTPSLFRLKHLEDTTEQDMVNSFNALRPEAFINCNSSFELLAKMQHYGLPTRLLDFTTNPLVALYFACENKLRTDGRVFCLGTSVKGEKRKIIDVLCESYKYNIVDDHIEPFESFLEERGLTIFEYFEDIFHTELIARPEYWNQRIINQSAVFMVFPSLFHDNYAEAAVQMYYGKPFEACNWISRTEDMRNTILCIQEIEKPYKFYSEEESCMVVPEYWSTIQRSYAEKKVYFRRDIDMPVQYKNNFVHRFRMTTDHLDIEANCLNNNAISIIVDGGSKSRIIRELEVIGIDEAFIFPELEYTARKIAKHYR